MTTVTSADGTTIAFEHTGIGPPIVLVDGAMCFRAAGPMRPLAELLENRLTVFTYDRRGRGESTDTTPYAVEREVEDLRAVIAAAGGRAGLYSMSSGGALALATAAAEPGVTGLALFEPPYLGESGGDTRSKEYTERLRELLDADRRGEAVELFMTFVGVPAPGIAHLKSQPGWATFEAIAPTLAYDDTLLDGGHVPRDLAASVTVPTVVVSGTASPGGLQQAALATAEAVPGARHVSLEGQTHDVDPSALAPVLVEFFGA